MSSFPALNDEQWLKLLEQAASTFNEVTLNRGFTYFKQQRVTTLIVSENRMVQARVTGSEEYKVMLHVDKLKASSCTCPVQTSCKHLAAVMMELADRLGHPVAQIVNAKQYLRRTDTHSPSASLLNSLPDMDVFSWHQFLDQYTSHVKPGYNQGIFMEALRDQLQNIRKGTIPFSEMDRMYFELHQELFILRKINEQTVQSSVNYYTSFALYRMSDEIHALLKQKSALFHFTLAVDRLKETLSYIRQQIAEETGHNYLNFGLYTELWKHWIAPHPEAGDWMSQEMNHIEKTSTDSMSDSLSTVKAYLYLHQSRSKEAWAALEASGTLKKAPASLFLPFLNHLSDSSDWGNLVDWLIRTASSFYGRRTKEFDAYMNYRKQAIAHFPEAEKPLWNVLEGMLPHSAVIIEELLYEQRKWKPWIEMQILQGHDPLHHRVSVLQPVENGLSTVNQTTFLRASCRY